MLDRFLRLIVVLCLAAPDRAAPSNLGEVSSAARSVSRSGSATIRAARANHSGKITNRAGAFEAGEEINDLDDEAGRLCYPEPVAPPPLNARPLIVPYYSAAFAHPPSLSASHRSERSLILLC